MSLKHKALGLILVCLLLGSAAGACSSFVGQKPNADVETAEEDDGGEEVLDPDGHDDFADSDDGDEDGEAEDGGVLVAVTYLVLALGMAALPYLLLL